MILLWKCIWIIVLKFSQKVCSKRKYITILLIKIYLGKIFYIMIFYSKNIINTTCWIRKYIDSKSHIIKLFSLISLLITGILFEKF